MAFKGFENRRYVDEQVLDRDLDTTLSEFDDSKSYKR